MGFTDLVSEAGLTLLNNFVKTRSYIIGYTPSQADVKVFQQIKEVPAPEKYPYAWRWYNHMLTFEGEFDSLPGDPTKEFTAYGPEIKEERLAEYNKKKAGKTKPAAKSIVTLDVKPWDDETNMEELKANVLAIEKDGLVWGGSKLVAVGFGIKKLQLNVVIEDDKVSLDDLQAQIEEDEDHVQSTDVVAMQKL
ncbi:EFB1 Translation elongation factor EF-1beta [Pyrenophora tritici-repentis]|nr:Elongation factor 1-beta [Pyrenophora tritici-repentis]KAI0589455.1 Elongation factor 1-beta [Pyrenophora tritici-repentis]KAI0608639.1 Elongation factor 1-beta [Pyrenophora tritici-repentis]KAI0620807.1 Elongation factor 1-beta [Pyrenophora tritici-repentis]KAI1532991.1 EFB1 Translation elongation factor EF-1beta [Pyrenophora tritici-repentis]